MSTQAYRNGSGGGERPPWHAAQSAMLQRTGSFYYLESLCPDFAPIPSHGGHRHWMCESFETREECCMAQIFTVLEYSSQSPPVPTMIRAQVANETDPYFDFLTAAFLTTASEWSYVAMGVGWNGPRKAFPWFKKYDTPLGAPLGAVSIISRKQGVLRREFEHITVELNVSAWSAKLTPKSHISRNASTTKTQPEAVSAAAAEAVSEAVSEAEAEPEAEAETEAVSEPEAAAEAAAGRSHSAHVLKSDDDPAAAAAVAASPGARSQQLILTGGDTATVGCTPSNEFNCSYAAFRIPALVNAGGVLMVFAEGRRYSCSDFGISPTGVVNNGTNGQVRKRLFCAILY